MRIHLCTMLFIIELAVLYQLDKTGYIILFLLYGMLIGAEMVNTAMEVLVDLGTKGFNTFARIAKDVAAGAVLIVSIAGVAVWILLFSDTQKLWQVWITLQRYPVLVFILIAQLLGAIWFMFCWDEKRHLKWPRSKPKP